MSERLRRFACQRYATRRAGALSWNAWVATVRTYFHSFQHSTDEIARLFMVPESTVERALRSKR